MLFSTRGTPRTALMGTLVFLLIGAQANAQALPTGCNAGDPPIFTSTATDNTFQGSPTVAGTSFARQLRHRLIRPWSWLRNGVDKRDKPAQPAL
jgi:hypothetical protein